jgi:hypothetical protein
MTKNGGRSRLAALSLCALLGAIVAWADTARAFVVKRTSGGLAVHWPGDSVVFVINPTMDTMVSGSVTSTTAAVQAWSASGGPEMTVVPGNTPAVPAVDGQNSIIFANHGFLPAGDALAVTLVSFNAATGEIVDTDIVVNGVHSFGVLPSGTMPPAGTAAVAMEGAAGDTGDSTGLLVFDFQHVVAHEVGHSLGLSDSIDEQSALMYPYTKPHDTSVRMPAQDDVDGVSDIYAASSTAAAPAPSGCGKSSVAGSGVRTKDAEAAVALVFVAGAWIVSRRRARALVPVGAAVLALVSGPRPASSAQHPSTGHVDATARVVGATTHSVAGTFQTVVDLVPGACDGVRTCPSRARAHVWGGTMNGITQQVGEAMAPEVDDDVDLAFSGAASGSGPQEAVVLAVRKALRRP